MNATTPAKLFSLSGASVLITGAGSGMGQATAIMMAQAGARHVFLCGRRFEVLRETAKAIREAGLAHQCDVHSAAGDVTDAAFRLTLLASVKQQAGALDVLVNNAGLFAGNTIEQTTDQEWSDVYEVNVAAPFALTRDALPLLDAGQLKCIVNIGSTLADKPIPVAAAYNSAKAALAQLTRSLALELGPRRIRVNCIHPAIVETPMYRGRYATDDEFRHGMDEAARLHPLGRVGRPEDVAGAALFLASPAASWITGVALPVDGGMLVT